MSGERENITDSDRLEKVESIIAREELSPDELKDIVYLLWDLGWEGEDQPVEYYGEWTLTNESLNDVKSVSIYAVSPDDDDPFIKVKLLNSNKPGKSREMVMFSVIDGEPQWYIGIFDKYYSEFLGREVEIENTEAPLYSKTPLTPPENKKLALRIYSAYQTSVRHQATA